MRSTPIPWTALVALALIACADTPGGTGASSSSGPETGAASTSGGSTSASGSTSGTGETGDSATATSSSAGELTMGTTGTTGTTWATSGTTAEATSDSSTTDAGTTGGDPEDCSTNPIPWCTEESLPTPNGVPSPPPGLDGCPPGMARVDTFCVDRWEAALVEVLPGDTLGPWSPYASPAGAAVRAVSAPGLVPQGYISQVEASAACVAAGKRLCTDAEWLRACRGAAENVYPYGGALVPGACNDARTCHPAVQFFETSDDWIWSELGHPCLNQLPSGLELSGANTECVSEDGVFDMMGNLHEWTADPAGTFRGGFYVDTKINGPGCLYVTTAHNVQHWDYSTGFRCCAE